MTNPVSNNPAMPPLATGNTPEGAPSLTINTPTAILNPSIIEAVLKSAKEQVAPDNTIKNNNGAPILTPPPTNFSAADLIDMLRDLQSKSMDAQIKTASKSLEKAGQDAKANNEAQMKKIEEWIKKCEDAANASRVKSIFSWIGKIAAIVGAIAGIVVAVAATPFTGGAASVLVVLAVVGLVAATISLADQISQAKGGPEISISNLAKGVSAILQACGLPEDKADSIGKFVRNSLFVLLPAATLLVEPKMLGTVVGDIMRWAGVDANTIANTEMGLTIGVTVMVTALLIVMTLDATKAASGMANAASMATKIGTATKTAAQAGQGLTGIGSGIAGIKQAGYEHEGEKAIAAKKELEALMKKINLFMEDEREELKKLIQQLEDGMTAVSQMIQGMADNMTQINQNVGRRATA